MTITLIEAITTLRNGEVLKWESSGNFKAGQILLDTASARRLFDHFIDIEGEIISTTDERLFPDIVKAWEERRTLLTPTLRTMLAAQQDRGGFQTLKRQDSVV